MMDWVLFIRIITGLFGVIFFTAFLGFLINMDKYQDRSDRVLGAFCLFMGIVLVAFSFSFQ